MTRDTTSVFAQGAVIVPDFVTPAEEARILQRIGEAPWLAELSRRVQHYGYRYDYRGASRPVPAAPFPRWAEVMAERLGAHFGGVLPVQRIVNEYRPGQGIGMHADHADFGPVVASLSLADDWPMQFRRRTVRPLRPRCASRRRGRGAAAALRAGARRPGADRVDARHRPGRQRAPPRDPHLGNLPEAGFRRRSSVSRAQPVFFDLPLPGVAP